MSFVRRVLNSYRRIQYFFCGRAPYGVLTPGAEVIVEPIREEENHGDKVHPCIRYIPEGFEEENKLAEFLTKVVDDYIRLDWGNFDLYLEAKLIEKYGR